MVANRTLIKIALLDGDFDHWSHSENEAETPEEDDSKQIILDLQEHRFLRSRAVAGLQKVAEISHHNVDVTDKHRARRAAAPS